MTAPTVAAPGAATLAPDPQNVQGPLDVTRVLVVGLRPWHRVRWALTQTWRRAGRPLVVSYGPGMIGVRALQWCRAHDTAGIRGQVAEPGDVFDVVLLFGPPSPALRAALPVLRRVGIEVVDGDAVGEFR